MKPTIPHVLIDIMRAHLSINIYLLIHMDLHTHHDSYTYHTPCTYEYTYQPLYLFI